MAYIKKDGLRGGYRITGLEQDIDKARSDAQHRRDMAQIGQNFDAEMKQNFRDGAMATAALGAGTVAVGVGMVKNKRFRYLMQAILRFPMSLGIAFIIVGMPRIMSLSEEASDRLPSVMGTSALIALLIAIVWTALYVVLRTRRKLRGLSGGHG